MQLAAESENDTRDIADPASEEQSSNFHYADHLDIPLLVLRATGPQTTALLSGQLFGRISCHILQTLGAEWW